MHCRGTPVLVWAGYVDAEQALMRTHIDVHVRTCIVDVQQPHSCTYMYRRCTQLYNKMAGLVLQF